MTPRESIQLRINQLQVMRWKLYTKHAPLKPPSIDWEWLNEAIAEHMNDLEVPLMDEDKDYAEENGRIRLQQAFERALANCDPLYPPEYHEQDVRSRFGIEDENV